MQEPTPASRAPDHLEAPGERRPLRPGWRRREIGKREWWGYAVWFAVAVVIAVPELTAVWNMVPWPTISGTVGHLEYRWSWVALIVVTLVVSAGFHAIRYTAPPRSRPLAGAGGQELRTMNGRLTKAKAPTQRFLDEAPQVVPAATVSLIWFFGAVVLVVAASLGTQLLVHPVNPFMLAYVLYGGIAVLFILTPSVLAYWFRREVPFPTLFWTLMALERRVHLMAVAVYAGLVILLLHLALYPWPNVFHVLQPHAPPTVVSP